MNNYEYIIAGLPVFRQDAGKTEGIDAESLIGGIKEQCSGKDNETVDFLLSGFVPENLNIEFYEKALSNRNPFIREFFRFDLNVRNAKAEYLNTELGREPGLDKIEIGGEQEFEEYERTKEILSGKDLLERERGLDSLYWDKAEELVLMDIFDLELILSFLVKLKIIERWLKLDPETGKVLLRKLVDVIRKSK